ncbi:MAG TPA: glutamate mutase L [Ktedonobacterales bacterium]
MTTAAQREGGQRGPAALRSLMLIDCGSAFTKVALIGLVDERHRLLARAQVATTSTAPYPDITRALVEGCAILERATGRRLLHDGRVLSPEQEEGAGVDAIALATSVGGPLRLLTTGPAREALAGLVHRAIGGLFVQPEALPPSNLPADDERDPAWMRLVAQVRARHPHALLIVGAPSPGIRGGPIEETARSAARWLDALRRPGDDESKPLALPVIFSGTTEDGVKLAATLRASTPAVHPVEGLSPATLAPLTRTVSAVYENVVLREVPGFAKVRAVTPAPPVAASVSLGEIVRLLATRHQMTVIGADVGASATLLAASTAQGELLPAACPQGGVGGGAGHVLRSVGAPNILRWLSLPADENAVREHVLMRMLRPRAIPTTPLELELDYALAREALRLAKQAPGSRVSGLHPVDVILGTGGVLTSVPHPAIAALILLDALQPHGITSFALDTAGLATMLGAACMLAGELVADVAESDTVSQLLGPVISVAGTPAPGSSSVRVVLEYEDGRKHATEVPYGSMWRIPLGAGERALLSLYPSATLDVGLGPGQQARASEPLEGGVLGVVVDARGRPLAVPTDPAERVARLREWQRALDIPLAENVFGTERGR